MNPQALGNMNPQALGMNSIIISHLLTIVHEWLDSTEVDSRDEGGEITCDVRMTQKLGELHLLLDFFQLLSRESLQVNVPHYSKELEWFVLCYQDGSFSQKSHTCIQNSITNEKKTKKNKQTNKTKQKKTTENRTVSVTMK